MMSIPICSVKRGANIFHINKKPRCRVAIFEHFLSSDAIDPKEEG